MKKHLKLTALILTLSLLASMLAACGGQPSQPSGSNAPAATGEQEAMTIQWAFTPPSGSNDEKWHHVVGDRVNENTSGAITYEYYPNGTLGNEKVTLEGVISGTINQASISPNVVATVMPEMNVLCLPFVFDSLEHYYDVVSSEEYYEKMNEAANKVGMQYLGVDLAVPRNISLKGDPVIVPSDAKGQVLRVMDGTIYTDMMKLWGLGSSVISYGETYTAMQQGVIDGIENSNDGNLTMKFTEVVDNTTNTYHVYHTQATFMNLNLWNSLTAETQEAIHQAFLDTYPEVKEEMPVLAEESAQQVRDAGVEVYDLTDEQRQEWIDASQPLYEQYRSVIGEEFYDWFIDFVDSKRYPLPPMFPAGGAEPARPETSRSERSVGQCVLCGRFTTYSQRLNGTACSPSSFSPPWPWWSTSSAVSSSASASTGWRNSTATS